MMFWIVMVLFGLALMLVGLLTSVVLARTNQYHDKRYV